MTEPKAITNPFPGLRPFETDEYRLFFGREGQSDALIERLQRARFLAVVGTSGSGKSSLVRAGLLPALRGGMMAGAGAGWRVAVMRPGHDPIGNLARVLSEEGVLAELGAGLSGAEGEAVVEATLRRGSLGLVEAARQARLGAHEKLLVVVDQFEELFRFRTARASTDTDDASAFVKLLLEARQADAPEQARMPIYVVLTMRSDFLGDCAQFQGLPEAINDGQYLIPRMTRDERRFAIVGPVRVARGKISEPLVNRLLNDVGDNPDQLPILQHALMRTWDYWQRRRADGEPIGLEHYAAVGTMSDALSLHADEAWDELPDERSRYVAETLFKALTERGTDNREIRRPTSLSVICQIADASEAEVVAVVEIFRREGRSFLMPPAGGRITSETVIDISHESLIRNWDRLKVWVKDEAEAARIYRRLAEAAMAYRTGEGGLLDEVTLQWVQRWRDKYAPTAAWGVRYHPEFATAIAYLEESRAARDAAVAERERMRQEELARERREREQAERFAAQQSSAAQRMRRFTFALVLISLLALAGAGGAAYAFTVAKQSESHARVEQKRAEQAKTVAETLTTQLQAKRGELEARTSELQKSIDAFETSERGRLAQTELAEQRALTAQKATTAANVERKRAETEAARALALAKVADDARKLTDEQYKQLQAATDRNRWSREGLASFQRGQYDEALNAFETVRQSTEKEGDIRDGKVTNPDISSVHGWALANLGATQRKLGSPAKAVTSYEHALKILEEVLDPDDPVRFDTYHGLAHAYRDTGQLDKAEGFFKRSLDFLENNLAGQPSEVAAALENVARLYRDLGRNADAEPLYKRIVELREKEKADSPETISSLREFAQFYVGQKKYAEAQAIYAKVLSVQEQELSAENFRGLSDSYSELGEVYLELNEEAKAETAFRLARLLQNLELQSRQIERAESGADKAEKFSRLARSSGLPKVLEEVADLYALLGRYEKAGEFYATLSAIKSEIGDANGAAEVLLKGARIYEEQLKNYTGAQSFYLSLVETLKTAQGSNPVLIAWALTGLGRVYAEGLNNPAEAEANFKEALDVLGKTPGSERETYRTLAAMASFYKVRAKNTELLAVNKRRLEVAGRLLDESSPNTVAQKAWDAGAYTEAFGLYTQAVKDLSETYLTLGDRASAGAALATLLDEKLDPDKVLDAGALDAYAKTLESHGDLLATHQTSPTPSDRVAARIKEARAQQSDIEQISRRQEQRQAVQQVPPLKTP